MKINHMKFAVAALLFGLDSVHAAISQGKCIRPGQQGAAAAVENIDVNKLQGEWHPIYADKQTMGGFQPQCVKMDISIAEPSG